jgi:hypothetical protein
MNKTPSSPENRLSCANSVNLPWRLRSADPRAARAQSLRELSEDFKALQIEEHRTIQELQAKDFLYAHFSIQKSGESSSWWLAGVTTEKTRAEFEMLATEGGIAFGSPAGTSPQDHLLHGLFLDLRATDSNHLRMFSDHGGIVERLCEAAATYCIRMDRRSLEETVTPIAPPQLRRGYRADVRHWMAFEGIGTVEAAAKRLGLSLSALKSIMSNRGTCRYGNPTLSRVLGRIGYKGDYPCRSPLSPLP